jgi:hypothetical protein
LAELVHRFGLIGPQVDKGENVPFGPVVRHGAVNNKMPSVGEPAGRFNVRESFFGKRGKGLNTPETSSQEFRLAIEGARNLQLDLLAASVVKDNCDPKIESAVYKGQTYDQMANSSVERIQDAFGDRPSSKIQRQISIYPEASRFGAEA